MGKLKDVLMVVRHTNHVNKILNSDKYLSHRLEGEIMRSVHSIEKGLSLVQPRKLFGLKKINAMLNHVDQYMKLSDVNINIIRMVIDSLCAYLNFHRDREYSELDFLRDKVKEFTLLYGSSEMIQGGVQRVSLKHDESDYLVLKKIAYERHSIRDFSGDSVPMGQLRKAIEIAQRAPSACNRQGVRAYVITGKYKDCLKGWLEGTGGFSDAVDKYILITGRLSSYRKDEHFQYIVSVSIFAGYLTLALQSQGIGSCIIQRSVLYNKKWAEVAKSLCIPGDEQAVLMIGVGMPKEEYTVPISWRLQYDEQVKEL